MDSLASNIIRHVQMPGSGSIYSIVDYSTDSSKGTLQSQINDLANIVGGGVNFQIAWTETDYAKRNAPDASKLATIPEGVYVYYDGGSASASGTLTATSDTKGTFILLYSKTSAGDHDKYDEYVTISASGVPSAVYSWEKIGDTQIDLSGIVTDASLSTTASNVLGTNTTAVLTSNAVTFGTPTTTSVLTSEITFNVTQPTITVTPATTYLKGTATDGGYANPTASWIGATATGTSVGGTGTASAITSLTATDATFVKNISTTVSKLVTTTVPNVSSTSDVTVNSVTSIGKADTWSFSVGGDDGETLIIGGSNGVAPSISAVTATKVEMGTAKTVATGSITSNGGGSSLLTGVTVNDSGSALTGLNTPTTATVLTGVEITSQPTITLAAAATSATGKVQAISSLGTFTQPTITLASDTSSGTGKVLVAKGILSAEASGGDVALGTLAGAIAGMTSVVTAMPTATVSTGITITKDNVSALTSATLSVTKG